MRELLAATDKAGSDIKKYTRDALRTAAEPIRDEAAVRFAPIDLKSASRFGISVLGSGKIRVEQRLRKTSGRHPEFGRLQMGRALIPALAEQPGRGAEERRDGGRPDDPRVGDAMKLVIEDVPPYSGEYEMDMTFTNRELHRIKTVSEGLGAARCSTR